jgi:hypothetical protein
MKKRYLFKHNVSSVLGIAVLFGSLAQSSFASIITNGNFAIAGTLFVTNPGIAAVVTPAGTCPAGVACIFYQDPTGTVAGNGKLDISASGLPNGDIPLAIAGNDAANVFAQTNPPEIVGSPGFAPTLFMSFNNAGITTQLMLTLIDAGIYSSAACGAAPVSGQQCTLPGSLFNFVNNPPPTPSGTACGSQCQATATWAFEGITAGNPGGQSRWVGNFTSQFPLGSTYQSVFAQLQANGFVSNTFSGTISLVVPEPGTPVFMIGAGLVGIALVLRRRRVAH